MKLIVGLGNPGNDYDLTRHNIGFMVLENFAGSDGYQQKFKGLYKKKSINGEVVYFLKPQTFMNLSGESVREFVNYFKIEIDDILVIQDDLDLEVGNYKLKKKSSSGGHNGIKSIIQELKTDNFARLKIGISSNNKYDVIDFVLGRFKEDEYNKIMKNKVIFNEIIDSFITYGIDKTMNKYNTK